MQGASDLLDPLNAALAILANMDAPLIAKVHGVAAGVGMSLMIQADFVLAAEGTRFNPAYINIGTSCNVGASWALPRLVGLCHALEIAMLGETLSGEDGLRLGPASQLSAETQAFLECARTQDFAEGVNAFFAKRPARFPGQ